MRHIIIKIFFFCFLVSSLGCSTNKEKSIKDTVAGFYKNYDRNFRNADTSILSKELQLKIKSATDFEKQSSADIKKSDTPTDKPNLLEGELFAGLYEGYTEFNIKEVIEKKESAIVVMEFINTHYDIKWNDDVVLVQENGWKIDNINYHYTSGANKNLKQVLNDFLSLKK